MIAALLASLLALVSIYIYSAPLAFIFLSFFLTSHLISPIISKYKSLDSSIARLAITIVIYTVLLQSIILLSWALSREFPLTLTPLLYTAILILILIYRNVFFKKLPFKNIPAKTPFINISDIVSAGVALLFSLFMIAAPLYQNGLHQKSNLLSIINTSTDDANHAMMINDRLQFNRGVFLNISNENNNRLESLSFYPAGWHSFNALLIKALNPNIEPGLASLLAYGLTKVVWSAFSIFLFTKSIFLVYYTFIKRANRSIALYTFVSIAALLSVYWLITDIFNVGFYSFIPQFFSTSAFLILLLASLSSEEKPKYDTIALLTVIALGGSLSWILVLPIFAFFMIAWLLLSYRKNYSQIVKVLSVSLLRNLPFYSIVVLATLLQLLVMSKSTHAIPFTEAISLPGRIAIYSQTSVYVLCAGLVISLVVKDVVKKKMEYPYLLIGLGLVYCFALYIIQITTVHEPRYYFFKAMYVPLALIVPFAILGFTLLLLDIQKKSSAILTGVSLTLLVVASLFIISPNPNSEPTYEYFTGIRPLTALDNESIYNELKHSPIEKYDSKEITLYFDDQRKLHNDLSIMLARTNKINSECFTNARAAITELSLIKLPEPIPRMMETLKPHCLDKNFKIRLIVPEKNVSLYDKSLDDIGFRDSITVLSINESALRR